MNACVDLDSLNVLLVGYLLYDDVVMVDCFGCVDFSVLLLVGSLKKSDPCAIWGLTSRWKVIWHLLSF